jgi:hypothetical protein
MNIIYIAIGIVILYCLMNKSSSEGFSDQVKCTYYSMDEEKMVYGLTDKKNCKGGYIPETN